MSNSFQQQVGTTEENQAKALEEFDARLPEIISSMKADDILVLSADHGCDPTWQGTDHTREVVPVIVYGQRLAPRALGTRDTFADIGQSIAKHLNIEPLEAGTSFLEGV